MSDTDPKTVLAGLTGVNRRMSRAFGVVILLLMLIVLISSGFYINGIMERSEQKLSTILTRILATSVSRITFSGRYHTQLMLEEIQARHPDIRYLLITDQQGKVLASSNNELKNTRLQGEANALALRAQKEETTGLTRHIHIDGESIIEVSLPYRGGFDNSIQGAVQVGISIASREAALRQGILLISLLVLSLFALSMVIVRKLSRHFGDPVQQLARDMAATLQAMPDLLFELDSHGKCIQVLTNRQDRLANVCKRMLGKTVHTVLPEKPSGIIQSALDEASKQGESHGKQFALPLDGDTIWFELSVARKHGADDEGPRFIVLSRDITERKQAEKELDLYANVFEHSGEAILITDCENRIVAINPALTETTGYTLEELRGEDPKILSSGHTPPETYNKLWLSLEEFDYWQGELWDRSKNGDAYPKWTSISAIRNKRGKITNYIASYTDITERKEAEKRIEYIAHHDPLTGLLNRLSLEERLGQAVQSARRDSQILAVLFINMDRFKTINDTMGHHSGDMLLVEVARRIKNKLRESDVVARVGGDEFIIVLNNIESAITAASMANKLTELLSMPYHIDGAVLHTSPSIGISLFPTDGDEAESLMKNADTAMYHAKEMGRNNHQFFALSMNKEIEERLALENELYTAIRNQEFELYYQPIVSTNSPAFGVEALVRWNHPEKGLISPDKFIPVAEETGLIIPLGAWIIDEACRQRAEWRHTFPEYFSVSINVSVHQLYSPELITQVRSCIERHHIREGEIKLELTESTAMENPEHAIQQLYALRQLGVTLAIDDFGTGYSSLAYLKRLPIQTLKLDRAFVSDIATDQNDAEISAATIALAHNLGLTVVAEGVEDEVQRDFLIQHQCDFLQGYFFSKPLPSDKVVRVLKETTKRS